MTPPKNAIYKWLQVATTKQVQDVAKAAKTSRAHLRNVATGRRSMSAEFAQTLAHASLILKVRALRLDQRELCKACGVCQLIEHKTVPKGAKPKTAAKAK